MIEREVKLRNVDHVALRRQIAEQGGFQLSPAQSEDNQLWDRESELRDSKRVLRVRHIAGRTVLTFKGPVTTGSDGERERTEFEFECSPGESVEPLLHGLGYRPTFRYQKVREAWSLYSHEILLDRTPMGDFTEIEGPEPSAVMAQLGIGPEKVAGGSYPRLWSEYRMADESLPADMVWEDTPAQTPRPAAHPPRQASEGE